jgi:hypothetical protein
MLFSARGERRSLAVEIWLESPTSKSNAIYNDGAVVPKFIIPSNICGQFLSPAPL